MRVNDDSALVAAGSILIATRDGTPLQVVVLHRDAVDKPLKHTKRQVRKDMSPLELSEVLADEFASNPGKKGFEMLERAPATVADAPGFRMLSVSKNERGLRKKHLVYGRLEGSWFYWLMYEAPENYYFEANLAAFEDVVKSFHIAG
jgi:hypothetical protein